MPLDWDRSVLFYLPTTDTNSNRLCEPVSELYPLIVCLPSSALDQILDDPVPQLLLPK
jgi:hypothetical protein